MVKQLLIYESVVPISAARHATAAYEPVGNYAFSASASKVPLMAVEFARAAAEYAIVFSASGDDVLPAAVLGLRLDQNLYLSADAHWQAKYIPAFIRRYPFVFSTDAKRTTLTLCVDEAHPGLNRDGRGQRLFNADGTPSDYTTQVLAFLKEYQAHFERTKLFGRRLKELDLLEPMQARVTTQGGEKLMVGGFMVVSRSRLRALEGHELAALAKSDELELLYLHLYSMRNFNEVRDRLNGHAVRAEAPVSAGLALAP
jgi:SapC